MSFQSGLVIESSMVVLSVPLLLKTCRRSSWRAAVVAHGPAATGVPETKTKTKTKTSATAPPTCANAITAPAPVATQNAPASARTSLGDGLVLPV